MIWSIQKKKQNLNIYDFFFICKLMLFWLFVCKSNNQKHGDFFNVKVDFLLIIIIIMKKLKRKKKFPSSSLLLFDRIGNWIKSIEREREREKKVFSSLSLFLRILQWRTNKHDFVTKYLNSHEFFFVASFIITWICFSFSRLIMMIKSKIFFIGIEEI